MKVAIYVRVSTNEQDLDTQVFPLVEYAERNKFEVYKIYKDFAQSGAKDSRPALNEMLDDMRKGKFKSIFVFKLDRIGRSIQHLITLFQEFKKRGVEFFSLTQNIDTTTPEGRMFLNLLMIMAEYERELTQSRINAGIERALKQGKKLGRPSKHNDKDMYRIIQLLSSSSDWSISKLSEETGLSRSAVYRLCLRAKKRGLLN